MLCDHGGNIWEAAAREGLNPGEILDFSANLNPLGPPREVLQELCENLGNLRHYPEPRGGRLRNALADRYGVPRKRMMVGNGAAELIYLLFAALRPRRALIPVPAFSEYARAINASGGETELFPLSPEDGFAYPLIKIARRLTSGVFDCLVLCNPANPSGTLTLREEILDLARVAKNNGVFVLVDESFMGFMEEPSRASVAKDMPGAPDNLFLLGSFTKLFALPGLRLGYGIGPEPLITRMEAARDPWSVNSLAQLAGLRCLDLDAYMKESLAVISRERSNLSTYLRNIRGIKPYPSTANFILCDLHGAGITASAIRERLLRQSVLIRDCSNFPGLDPYFFRVAVRLPEENRRLASLLTGALNAGIDGKDGGIRG